MVKSSCGANAEVLLRFLLVVTEDGFGPLGIVTSSSLHLTVRPTPP